MGTDKIRKPDPPARCGGCDATWRGTLACHCSGCHRTFAGIKLFDRHRVVDSAHGSCLDPVTIRTDTGERVMEMREGMWRGPEMTEEHKIARFGVRA